MCYYAEWDERFQQAAKEMRKSKEQTEQLMSRAKEGVSPTLPDIPTVPEKQPAEELDEIVV